MGTGECGEDELASVRVTLGRHHLITAADDLNDLGKVREVEVRRHTLGIEVERESNEIDVPGPLAITEEAAFDSGPTRENAKLCGSDSK